MCGHRPETYFFVLKNEDRFAYAGVSIHLFSDFSYVEDLPGDTVKALVSPRIVPLTELKSLEKFQAVLSRQAFLDTEPDVIVRDYVEEDSLKQIHWKATAREGRLKVRTRTGGGETGNYDFL